jgi:hypothetical protein
MRVGSTELENNQVIVLFYEKCTIEKAYKKHNLFQFQQKEVSIRFFGSKIHQQVIPNPNEQMNNEDELSCEFPIVHIPNNRFELLTNQDEVLIE